MADVTPARTNIQEEEVKFKAAVSEALLARMAGSNNFINDRQFDSKQWFINGPYGNAAGTFTGLDGAYVATVDMEITAISMVNLVAGSSGTTTFDIRKFTASNTPAGGDTIFTTKPSITSAAGNNAYLSVRFNPTAETLENPAGTTLPILVSYNLNKGDMLTCNLDARQVGGESCSITIEMRPR